MRFLALVMVLACAGCASSHKAGDGVNPLGGGIAVLDIAENVWFITAEINFAPWENLPAARTMWSEQAQKSCAEKSYTEYETSEHVRNHVPPIGVVRYLISVKTGFAVCGSSSYSKEEIALRLEQSGYNKVLDAPDVSCEGKAASEEDFSRYFSAGKSYYAARRYDEARSCFEISADGGAGNREAMKYLGLMHELGKGVPKSLDTAKFWYQKAGMTNN